MSTLSEDVSKREIGDAELEGVVHRDDVSEIVRAEVPLELTAK